ncbi:hypothetical protein RQN30_07835 [Arcanobacterium hippocoleae]
MLISLLSFAPIAGIIIIFSPKFIPPTPIMQNSELNIEIIIGMLILWAGYAIVFMGIRAATMHYRVKGTKWIQTSEE